MQGRIILTVRYHDVSLSKIVRPSFDLSFVNRYVVDTSYVMICHIH